jgi:hypothetical protein
LYRSAVAILTLLLTGPVLLAQDRAAVSAATTSAIVSLRDQINHLPLGREMSVGQYLSTMRGSDDILDKTLQRSEMVGGPRWLDDQTVQVRLQISGARVAQALIQIAASHPRSNLSNVPWSPYSPEFVEHETRIWSNRTFMATGTSTGGKFISAVRPPMEDANWVGVSDETRRQAIDAARASADQRVLDSIAPIQLAGGKTVGAVLADPIVKTDVEAFLNSRPVRSVQFGSDRRVTVTVGVRSDDLFDAFRAASVKVGAMSNDESAWFGVREQFARTMAEPVGAATPSAPAATAVSEVRAVTFDVNHPPQWVYHQIEAVGSAPPAGSKLRTARQAENDANRRLRSQIEALPLDNSLTVGQVARSDPRVRNAIEHAMDRAQLYKVDYHEDGSVTANVSLEPANLWGEIATGR